MNVIEMSAASGEREKTKQGKPASRREWTNPALVVLVRNRPEESVLDFCKSREASVGTSDQSMHYGCHQNSGCWADCYDVFTTS